MSWDVASIYPHNFLSSWCHLFCEVHQSLLQQCTHTTRCCHPRSSQLGWCSSACKPPPFSSKHNDGHYGQTVLFLFHQTRGHFSKKYDLCPHVQLQAVVCLFYVDFGAVASSFVERPFRLCQNRTRFTVDIDTFVPVSSSIFTRSFAVVLGLICTFRTKVRSSLGDRMHLLPEQYDDCVVPWCLYLHTIVCTDERGTFRRLEIAPKDEPDLWRSTIFFWGLCWFLLIFPWCQANRHWVGR